MNIAMFVETYSPSMGASKRNTLIVPNNDQNNESVPVLVFSRVTDGEKGPHNKWQPIELHSLLEQVSTTETVSRKPVGVYVTDSDYEQISSKGYSPVLGNKAMSASKNSPASDGRPAQEVIQELRDLVADKDPSLSSHIIDLRRMDAPEPSPTQTSPVMQPTAGRTLSLALASIPPLDLAKSYVNRDLFGKLDFDRFDMAKEMNEDVLIYGPTGPGKTTAVLAWAASRRLRVAQVSGNAALETSTLFGKDIYDHETGGFAWIDGPVTDVVRNGGVLILDEFNFISPKIYTSLYSLLDGRRVLQLLDHHGETIEAHPDLMIFATMNPEYVGTTPLNFAMRNRFSLQIQWDYDEAVEDKLIKSKTIKLIIKQMRSEAGKGEFETPISTNMAMELERFIPTFGYEFAVANFIAHFDKEEQDKVQLVFQTHEYNLREEFKLNEIVLEQDLGSEGPTPVADEVDAWLKKTV